jgi:hypothetical protein
MSPTSDCLRELDHRTGDCIDVWLLWRKRDDAVFVAVADAKTGARFSIEVLAGERPLDVFDRPYAYAASRGIDARRVEKRIGTGLD